MLDLIKGKLKNEFKLVVKRAVEILLEISKAFPGRFSPWWYVLVICACR